MKQHQYVTMAKVIQLIHPEIALQAAEIVKPKLTDLQKIRLIWNRFKTTFNPMDNFRDRLLFIAVILDLFSPSTLYGIRASRGVTMKLTFVMNFLSSSTISDNINQVRTYYKNPVFRDEVVRLSKEYKEL